jgi:mersacidin/lichenicidin family type 2 lantibiotic
VRFAIICFRFRETHVWKYFQNKREYLMSLKYIIEAWRDEEYRETLDSETRALLPENPAGEIELSEANLAEVNGGSEDITMSIRTPGSIHTLAL